jgi:hypothetical protein
VAEIGPWLAQIYGTLASVSTAYGAYPAGLPFAGYQRFAVEAGFPGQHRHRRRRGCGPRSCPPPVAITVHIGPREQMAPAYEALASWVSSYGGEPAGDLWEVYFSDPASEPDPATWPARDCPALPPGVSTRRPATHPAVLRRRTGLARRRQSRTARHPVFQLTPARPP